MLAHALTLNLNASNIRESFNSFETLGWKHGFEWNYPPTFGAVCSDNCEIFLCQGPQGGRGKSHRATTKKSGKAGDKGV